MMATTVIILVRTRSTSQGVEWQEVADAVATLLGFSKGGMPIKQIVRQTTTMGLAGVSESQSCPREIRLALLPETHAFARIFGCCEKFNAVLVFQHSLHCLENLPATRIHLYALVRLDHAHRLSSHASLQS
jgi:hypothetical protein